MAERASLLEGARRCGKADAGRHYDAFEIWERLHQRQRLLLVHLLALFTVGDLDELHLGEFRIARHLGLHEVDPGVLVGRGRGRGQDREFTFTADQVVHGDQHHFGKAFALHLIDEDLPRIGGYARIVRNDVDAFLRGALERGSDSVRVIAGDRDHADLLRDKIVDEFDLRFRGGLRRRRLDDAAADLLRRLFGAALATWK